MTFGLVSWAIAWNIIRIRLLYVNGLFRGEPPVRDASLKSTPWRAPLWKTSRRG